ncbi:MAG TPA: hypothetical protein ACFYD4_06165 [Candidatus Wunengus sp. YC61]|uniref:hypothetical protein n=1 Tax=Candidatus Wunengus sp. YC61 TaxID=3367698 RepID=UPI00402A35A6
MKPDLICCHIKHCYYPMWMDFIMRYHDRFNKIIIHFSEHNRQPYFDHFIHSRLGPISNVVLLDQAPIEWGLEDWRNIATKEMLKYSHSEWVASIEQDWLCRDWDKLFTLCDEQIKTSDMFGWMNMTNAPYIHPAFFFAKRQIIEEAKSDFTPHPEINGGDHFCAITWSAKEKGRIVTGLPGGEVRSDALAFHLGGVNANYLDGTKTGIFHRPDIFSIYNWWSLKQEGLPKVFITLCEKVREMIPISDPEKSEWIKFFKI